MTDETLRQYVMEWQEAKPGIDRLNMLESDLAFLIEEINRLSELNTAPEPYAEPVDNQVLVADVEPYSAPEPVEQGMAVNSLPDRAPASLHDQQAHQTYSSDGEINSTAGANTGLHLASFLKPQSAQFGWYLIQRRDGNLLEGLSARLEKIEKSRQILYSLKVGPFNSAEQAQTLCQRLKARQYLCQVGDFNGQAL
ncbi:SPOR domain-containing protein [Bowmanella denitrificans]|uniref:SPOR domain-containing protein n=1 Tax=Bowmanella denitrificans TaxID=366582 RepID=UPI000C9C3030|nr:SPOR domain-containing protein [Bowmanella denitrificans]